MKRNALIGLTLLLAQLGAEAGELRWKKYENGRFGYILSYPAELIAGPESMNGDGRELHSRDGEFSLAVSAHFFVEGSGDSFEGRWSDELKLGNAITYKRKTPTWFVVSGVKEGTEFYHRLYRKGENWVSFHITYPQLKRGKYDPWVEQIAKIFVPFRAGDYDRLE